MDAMEMGVGGGVGGDGTGVGGAGDGSLRSFQSSYPALRPIPVWFPTLLLQPTNRPTSGSIIGTSTSLFKVLAPATPVTYLATSINAAEDKHKKNMAQYPFLSVLL